MDFTRKASFGILAALCLLLTLAGCGQKSDTASVPPATPESLAPQQQQMQNAQAQGAAADAQKSAAARQAAGH